MIVLDANVLLYAYDLEAPQQPATAFWLENLIKSGEPIGLPWVSIWAFIRIATNQRLWRTPLDAVSAFGVVSAWLRQPGVFALQAGPGHAEILERLVVGNGAVGPLVMDAVLAALAIENGAVLASTDQDFRRFPELKWVNPLAVR